MYVEFKKLSFSNIMSYGASGAEIEFQPGFNTITAVNGSGKSTILDALTFALFGKPYRDIKLSELVNTQNGKGLEVSVEFRVGKSTYVIERGLKPVKFTMTKNGKELDLLSSKKLNQDEIDKILGINYRLFKNIVAMGVTNNKPFLSMPAGDKRALIENIFNIDVLGLMQKDVKKRKSVAQTEQALKQTELKGISGQVADNREHARQLEEYIRTFNESKADTIAAIQGRIDSYNARMAKAVSNIGMAQDKIAELEGRLPECPDADKMSTVDRQIGMAFSDMERISATLEKLSKKPTCPVCGSPLDEGHAKEHLDAMRKEYEDTEKNRLPRLQVQYAELRAAADSYRSAQEFIRTAKSKVKAEESVRDELAGEIRREEAALEREKAKECPANVGDTAEKIASLEKAADELDRDIAALDESIAVDTELVRMLGDDGIKTYFFRRLTGVLNKAVNRYLAEFELKNTELSFDEQLEESIVSETFPRSYESFSAGERTRIDMAVLISFFEVSRIISNWSCNLVMVDEIMDNGIDQPGIKCFAAALNELIRKNGRKLGVYIISHRLSEIALDVRSRIEIKKEHGYSNLKVTYE